jgi:nicotinamide-nucleotide amidase
VDVIISTGGLGPTADDLTRQAIAAASGDVLVEDVISLEEIKAVFASRRREMPEVNRVQALRPSRALAISNPHGTAPGIHAVIGDVDVFCAPGPPGELFPMFREKISPMLRPEPGRLVRTRIIGCCGIGESEIATRLGGLMDRERNPLVGTTASGGVVTCRVRVEGVMTGQMNGLDADGMLDEAEREIRGKLGVHAFATGHNSLPRACVEELKKRGQKLSVVESCTSGMVGAAVTEVAGSSAVFVGGLLTYSNELKEKLAGVKRETLEKHGAVSAETAREMAVGGCQTLGCEWCVSVTGIAGPDGGSAAKPVGTVWIGIAGPHGVVTRRFAMSGERQPVRQWSVTAALGALWMDLHQSEVKMLREQERQKF